MNSKIEENMRVLWEEMRRLGSVRPLTPEIAARLGTYREAYKSLHMLCEPEADPGAASGGEHGPLTKETAMAWIGRMQNADGTSGPHWTMEQTEQARKQRSIECDPLKFYVTMNMMYSDYCKAAEKVSANSMDFYAYMSKAFLDDKDAQPDKLEQYYNCIVKK